MPKPYQYRYLKFENQVFQGKKARFFNRPIWPLMMIFLGFGIIGYFFAPSFLWYFSAPKSQNVQTVEGQNSYQVQGMTDESGIYIQKEDDGFSYFVTKESTRSAAFLDFKLSIPKLKIKNAKVLVNSQDFRQSLSHLPGTALPGETGNVFITGHSILPQFFSPQNYISIFSTLSQISPGDEVVVEAGGIEYTYQVIKISAVDPSDLSVISPPDEVNRYMTLMTCVPPGMSTHRLVVLTKLKNV